MHPSLYPNLLLAALKWPVALASLLVLPAAFNALIGAPVEALLEAEARWLLSGAALYALGWLTVFRHPFSGSYFSTFEHELTHALFAWATLHRVTGLKVTWRQGGVCTYEGSGGGNWLISIAPYWWPTLAVIPAGLVWVLDPAAHPMLHGLVGFWGLYHLTSTWRETHLAQPDLKETGFVFALLFLPSANLLSYGALVLGTLKGPEAAWSLFVQVYVQTSSLLGSALTGVSSG